MFIPQEDYCCWWFPAAHPAHGYWWLFQKEGMGEWATVSSWSC